MMTGVLQFYARLLNFKCYSNVAQIAQPLYSCVNSPCVQYEQRK
jgi:hypothetical protein